MRCCFSVCFGADVHPAIFPCRHWPADMDRQRLSVRATAEVRGLVTGLPPGWPSLSGAGTSELQRLASVQRYTQVCLSKLHFNTPHYQSTTANMIHINSSYSLCWGGACILLFHVSNVHVSACVYPSLPTDVAETVYSVGAKDDHGWTSLLHTYNMSLSEAQKNKILFALTCSRDTNKLHGYIFTVFNFSHN